MISAELAHSIQNGCIAAMWTVLVYDIIYVPQDVPLALMGIVALHILRLITE